MNIIEGMKSDVESIIDHDIGVQVTYTPVTVSQYGFDGESRTDGSTENRYIVLFASGKLYNNIPEGFFESETVVAFGKTSDNYNRQDKISFGGITYRITKILEKIKESDLLFTKRLELKRIDS